MYPHWPSTIHTKKILTLISVDSSVKNSSLLQTILKAQERFQLIQQFDSGLSSLEYCAENKPDIILIARNLPDMSDILLLKLLMKLCPLSRFVMSSATDEWNWMDAILFLGVDTFLTKPYGLDQVLGSLEHACRKYY
jgi:DNA-binding NarL/FixJ family response regulator